MSSYADAEINAMIIEKAREASKAEREEMQADLEWRQANELPDIPRVQAKGVRELVFKRHDARTPQYEPQMSQETADWADWVNDRIETRLLATVETIGAEMGKQDAQIDAKIKRLTDEIEALRAELRRRKTKQLRGPAEIKQLRGPTSVA